MGWAFWVVAGGLLALAVLAGTLAALLRAERSRNRQDVGGLRSECDELRSRVDQLSRGTPAGVPEPPDYVITRVGDAALVPAAGETPDGGRIPNRLVLSTAFGEPLVKALAFGHGVRRAMSAESRNRIGFEVRREMRRSKKLRRREMREAWKKMRAQQTTEGVSTSVAAQPARPAGGPAQPARPAGGPAQPARPPRGSVAAQPARPAGGPAQPARPPVGQDVA